MSLLKPPLGVVRAQPNKLASFYTDADKDEIQRLMMQQAHVWQKLKVTRGLPRETAFRHELHSIKASLRRYKQASRGRWVLDVVHTLELAMAIHDPKQLYNTSATLGIHAEGRSRALEHFDAVMNTPLEVTEETLQTLPRRVATAEHLAQIPGRADIDDAIAYLRESAPGADHATVLLLRLHNRIAPELSRHHLEPLGPSISMLD